jgi:putative ABC transport system permease protein
VNRNRKELAVLHALGATRRQLRAAIIVLAATLGLVAAAVGVPAGIVIGRLAWRATADGIGALTGARVEPLAVAVAAAMVVGASLLGAVVPAHRTSGGAAVADGLRR